MKTETEKFDAKGKGMDELQKTLSWFQQAIPNPTDEQKCIQIGCHYEEVSEMLSATGDCEECGAVNLLAKSYKDLDEGYAEYIKVVMGRHEIELLDALADQIVTAVGVAHMMGFDILGALQEVNRSNFSKFEDGKPVFNEQGKISKGKDYTPPNLTKFIG